MAGWPDDVLNYAFLISGEYLPSEEYIKMVFTTTEVLIKGSSLQNIFDDLATQNLKCVVCNDARYAQAATENPIITEISIS